MIGAGGDAAQSFVSVLSVHEVKHPKVFFESGGLTDAV